MTDITQQLFKVSGRIDAGERLGPGEASLLRIAVQQLQAQATSLANIPSLRFDRFFAAALQAVAGRSDAVDRHYADIVKEARDLAVKCVQAPPPGEDS